MPGHLLRALISTIVDIGSKVAHMADISITHAAVRILIADRRSGYADANGTGKGNIIQRYSADIMAFWGLDDEIKGSPEEIATWYADTFWAAP